MIALVVNVMGWFYAWLFMVWHIVLWNWCMYQFYPTILLWPPFLCFRYFLIIRPSVSFLPICPLIMNSLSSHGTSSLYFPFLTSTTISSYMTRIFLKSRRLINRPGRISSYPQKPKNFEISPGPLGFSPKKRLTPMNRSSAMSLTSQELTCIFLKSCR